MSNLVTRTLSGIVYISVIISAILLPKAVFGAVFAIIVALAAWEFYTITDKSDSAHYLRLIGTIGAALLFCSVFVHFNWQQGLTRCLLPYGIFIMIMMIAELFRKAENPIHNWASLILGQVMVALPFSSLNYIMFYDENGALLLLALFVIIWTNDTGAYCVGSLIGKHKMFPRVSPGKSWEGLIGGVLFAVIVGWIFSLYVSFELFVVPNTIKWIVFVLIVSLFGTLGDLMESLLKRTLGIKDSGKIIPGHGGMLDRFDSMLLAAPAIVIYLMLI